MNQKLLIAAHMAVLTGIDFFTVEVLTWRGLATYYVLFFIQLESRRVALAGITTHPDAVWMEQMARNAVDPDSGHLRNQRYILHDRDTKFCATFRSILETAGTKCLSLPPGHECRALGGRIRLTGQGHRTVVRLPTLLNH